MHTMEDFSRSVIEYINNNPSRVGSLRTFTVKVNSREYTIHYDRYDGWSVIKSKIDNYILPLQNQLDEAHAYAKEKCIELFVEEAFTWNQ